MSKYLHVNGFLAVVGFIALIEVFIIYMAIQLRSPHICAIGLIAGVLIVFFAKTQIKEVLDDERTELIAGKAASLTLLVILILIAAFGLSSVVLNLTLPPHPCNPIVVSFSVSYLIFPCVIILLYTALRYYYSYKYGGFENEE